MGLTRLAIRRPLTIIMLILAVVLMGAVAYSRLNVDRLPPISVPFVSVNVSYPGASPEDVEALVVLQVEDALSGVPGARTIRATAREGSGNVFVQLEEGSDIDKAFVEVQRRMAAIAARLPRDAGEPRINKFDPNASPIMNLALTGDDQETLYRLASEVVQPKLLSLPGVADVDLSGGLVREVQIRLDLAKLAGHGVSVEQVNQALQRENITAPAGNLDQGTRTVAVRSFGLFQKTADLGDLIVGTARPGNTAAAIGTGGGAAQTGAPIYLRNLATIEEKYRDRTRLLRYNGEDAIGISILKQSDANTIAVSDAVKAALEPLKVALPAGSDVVIVNDNSRFVRRSVNAIQFDLGLAALLTATVLVVFLHTWRNMVIVLLAIPTSLIATFLVMYAVGFSLNLMTLMALAMTIGILVDDSIVVLENIHRHLSRGELPREASLAGRNEIGLAAVAITLTDIIVYLPVAFMQGNVGQLFRQYGLTIAAATLFSLFIGFTLTPMLASRWFKQRTGEEHAEGWWGRFCERWERGFDRVASRYGRILDWALHHRPVIVVGGMLALALGLSAIPLNLLSSEYAPQEDDGQFRVSVNMPVGSSLQSNDQAARQMEAMLFAMPDVKSVYTSVGGDGGGFGGGGSNLTVEVEEKNQRSKTLDEVLVEVRALGRLIPDAQVRISVQNPLAGGAGGIAIDILGEDLKTLNEMATRVIEISENTPGIASATSSAQQQAPEVRFAIDRERAAALGVTATQVGTVLRTIVQGNVVSNLRAEGQPALEINVAAERTEDLSPSTLANVPVAMRATGPVRLGQVTTQRRGTSPTQIQRVDRKRSVQVNAQVAGRSLGDVARDLRVNLASELALPPGYRYEVRGTVQQMEAAQVALGGAGVMSIILIYMLLVALYESFLYPLAIMFALPVAVVGAIGGLLVTGNTLNIFSMIGVIALMGLVAKNAILLVDYTNTLRARGRTRAEALIEAATTRLRPIVMTSCTVIAAMLPLAMKFEAGAESRAPIAVVIMGGSLTSTLLTLVLVPVMYAYLDDLQNFLKVPHSFRWPWGRASTVEPEPEFVPQPATAGARTSVMASMGDSGGDGA